MKSTFELSYAEALAAFWRMYWVMILLTTLANYLMAYALVFAYGDAGAGAIVGGWPYRVLFQALLSGGALFLVVKRLVSRPYRKFTLVIVTEAVEQSLTGKRRAQLWFYIFWRLAVAGLIVNGVLLAPLNIVLSLMRIYLAGWFTTLATPLIVGPVVMKFLIGHSFPDFRIEARRPGDSD